VTNLGNLFEGGRDVGGKTSEGGDAFRWWQT
jgi:hypothetical protein